MLKFGVCAILCHSESVLRGCWSGSAFYSRGHYWCSLQICPPNCSFTFGRFTILKTELLVGNKKSSWSWWQCVSVSCDPGSFGWKMTNEHYSELHHVSFSFLKKVSTFCFCKTQTLFNEAQNGSRLWHWVKIYWYKFPFSS